MALNKIRSEKLSDTVAKQLENYILEGVLPPGEYLPAERDLAKQLDVSRPSLRDALQKLESQGLLETHQGGGTLVKNFLGPSLTNPLTAIFQNHPDTVNDFMEFRAISEGNAAYYAAQRATDADREILTACIADMDAAHEKGDLELEASIDADFHMNIAEAAHNVVLLHVIRSLVEVLKKGVFLSRKQLYTHQGSRDRLLAQHHAIYDAIMAGNPEQAQKASQDHLAYVQQAIRDLEREDHRIEVSKRRLERFMAKQRQDTKSTRKK
ncbi:FCD domain-containing protein [Kiloniella litopenaei]|uniref:FCD domain-containing protein n=1 Tax=Kiloniella litopenaei TaxID=1549748 RepID=UPI003BA949BD